MGVRQKALRKLGWPSRLECVQCSVHASLECVQGCQTCLSNISSLSIGCRVVRRWSGSSVFVCCSVQGRQAMEWVISVCLLLYPGSSGDGVGHQ